MKTGSDVLNQQAVSVHRKDSDATMALPAEVEHRKKVMKQVEALIDALLDVKDLYAPWSCLLYAAEATASRDCDNEHQTPVDELLPAAVKVASNRAKSTISWDWKANPDEIRAELNWVLNPRGLAVQYPLFYTGDDVEFEIVPFGLFDVPEYREPKTEVTE